MKQVIAFIKSWTLPIAMLMGAAFYYLLSSVDAIAFTAGIGENDGGVRERVCKYLGYLGIEIDADANKKRGEEVTISTPNSKVKVLVVPTNEELAICRETVALV